MSRTSYTEDGSSTDVTYEQDGSMTISDHHTDGTTSNFKGHYGCGGPVRDEEID